MRIPTKAGRGVGHSEFIFQRVAAGRGLGHSLLMRNFVLIVALSTLPVSAGASLIERACLKADRPAASQALCRCTQVAADRMLSERDQRLAATFFKDPDRAQEIRQSDRRSHEAFWTRYKQFRDQALASCRTP